MDIEIEEFLVLGDMLHLMVVYLMGRVSTKDELDEFFAVMAKRWAASGSDLHTPGIDRVIESVYNIRREIDKTENAPDPTKDPAK